MVAEGSLKVRFGLESFSGPYKSLTLYLYVPQAPSTVRIAPVEVVWGGGGGATNRNPPFFGGGIQENWRFGAERTLSRYICIYPKIIRNHVLAPQNPNFYLASRGGQSQGGVCMFESRRSAGLVVPWHRYV